MKIVPLERIGEILHPLRTQGKRIVLCHGCFDLLHVGHVRYFKAAKREGDVLVVTVTADRFVDKGPGRPRFTHDLRAEFIAELSCVDFVAVSHYQLAVEAISFVQPHVFAKGGDFKELNEALRVEKNVVETHGGRIHFTKNDYLPVHSSELVDAMKKDTGT